MAKLQHTFVQGKMNKDLDERLVPNGQYRDAKNIQVSTSEGSDVGAVENILGNTIQNLGEEVQAWATGFGLSNTTCIGAIRDSQNEKIYWFITSDTVDAILEYDQATSVVAPVLVDTNNVLNFSTSNLITGVNILGGMLFWTDDNSEPKKIEIARFKAGSLQGQGEDTLVLHTQVYGRPFIESDTTVILKSPRQATSILAEASLVGGNGTGIKPVTTFPVNFNTGVGAFYPLPVGDTVSITWVPFVAPNTNFNGKNVRLTTKVVNSDNTVDEFEVVGTLSNLTAPEVPGQYTAGDLTIVSISSDVPNLELAWKMLLIEEAPIFQNDFPRFSYRWKYVDGEYSTYAPFSEAAFIPNEFDYDTVEAHNLGMDNFTRKITLSNFETPPSNVVEVEVLYKGVASNNVYKLEAFKVADGALTSFVITTELLGSVIESVQLLRPWDNVPRKAKAQEIIGNRIVYGNYLQNYTINNSIALVSGQTNASHAANLLGEESVKSNRTYQIGVTFIDEFNRESPVFTNKTAAQNVFPTKSANKNALTASVSSAAPAWASHYKYYVKDPAPEYYNIVLDRFYDAQDGNVWLSFPSSERNKIGEDDYLFLKKQHGTENPVTSDNKYKVLEISNEAPQFISSLPTAAASAEVFIEPGSFVLGNTSINIHAHLEEKIPEFHKEFNSADSIQFFTANQISKRYEIIKGGPTGEIDAHGNPSHAVFEATLAEGISDADSWLVLPAGTSETAIRATLYKNVNEGLPEFQGRFFAKIPKNSAFITNVELPSQNSANFRVSVQTANNDLYEDMPLGLNPTKDYLAFGDTNASPAIPVNTPSTGSSSFALVSSASPTGSTLTTSTFNAVEIGAKIRFKRDGNNGQVYTVANIVESSYTRIIASKTFGFNVKEVTIDRNYTDTFGDTPKRLQILDLQGTGTFVTRDPGIFETEPLDLADLDIYYEASNALPIANLSSTVALDWWNCYSFGNGVESDRIRDDFNAPRIGKGVRVSSTLETPYEEERRGAGMIFSGIFNSRSGVNNTNQFLIAEDITQDLNPVYGSIQKLHARDTDLIALCEDKCFRILADKDALFNADGSTNVTSNRNVLGQPVPYVGEFGISKNPESFAMYGFRAYFTDKARGAVIRLSRDGITEISSKGMTDYFEDKLKSATGALIGSYDEQASSYNIKIGNEQTSFKEGVDGWSTRLSYAPEFAISLNNDYYSFKDGEIWEHTNNTRANFFGVQENTTVTTIFNDAPTSVKNFKTLSYEGDAGWTASITTNKQSGSVSTWKEREGIYFNYIKGEATTLGNIDTSEFSVQGIADVDYVVDGVGYYDLSFTSAINTSLQVGDAIYFVDASASNALKLLGDVLSITGLTVRAEWDGTAANEPEDGDFILFAKDGNVNTSGLIGYYAEAELTSAGGTKKELFAVNSEIFISSE